MGKNVKQTLIGQNGLFTSGFIGDRDFMPPKGNERKDWLYSTDISEGKDKNTLIIKPYRDMTDLGMGDGDDWIMGEYNRTSMSSRSDSDVHFRISEMEGDPVEINRAGNYPPAHIIRIDDPVHFEAPKNYEELKNTDTSHTGPHYGIDGAVKMENVNGKSVMKEPDFFSSKGGRVNMAKYDNLNYNPIIVKFADGSSQKTYHTSGNAPYIFDGQVLKAGEYVGRIGGMPNYGTHLH